MTTTVSHCPGATRPLVQAAGLEPASPPGAVLCRLSYVCVCPRWATSSRGARGPVGGSDWARTSDLIAIDMRSIPLNYAPVVCPDLSGSRSPVASWPARPLVMGCAPSLLPACQVMLSRFLRLTFTAGNDPVFPGADSRIRTGQDVLDTASLSPPLCVSACGRPSCRRAATIGGPS